MNGRGKQIATTKQLNQIIIYKFIKFMKHIKQLVETSKAIKPAIKPAVAFIRQYMGKGVTIIK